MSARLLRSVVPVVVLGIPLLTGCRFTGSELQRREYSAASPTAAVNGQTLTLSADLTREHRKERRFDLKGMLVLKSSGAIDGIDLVRFSLRPARAGYYVQNFVRNKDGSWVHSAWPPGEARQFSADVQRVGAELRLTFFWLDRGVGALKSPDVYDKFDVSVTISDQNRKHHILSSLAVPVTVKQAY